MKLVNRQILSQKLKYFFPYNQKILKNYLIYSSLFLSIGIFIIITNCVLIIMAVKHQAFTHLNTIINFNFAISPIFNILLVIFSWILLILAPGKTHKNTKKSIVIFYISFWCLTFASLLNGATVDLYFKNFVNSELKLSVFLILIKLLTIITFYAIVMIQIYFWIMRRKFTFSPTDYEIYTARIEKKRIAKQAKISLKLEKKRKNQNKIS